MLKDLILGANNRINKLCLSLFPITGDAKSNLLTFQPLRLPTFALKQGTFERGAAWGASFCLPGKPGTTEA
jgi:hypothetical protein